MPVILIQSMCRQLPNYTSIDILHKTQHGIYNMQLNLQKQTTVTFSVQTRVQLETNTARSNPCNFGVLSVGMQLRQSVGMQCYMLIDLHIS